MRMVRQAWRRLISMRTALILLFLLAVAAVPGSLLPQRPLNPTKTDAYLASHGAFGRFLDRLGAFDVFASPWFAAIYLLLFVSLIGCLIPRIRVHARALRTKPLPAPKNLARLPESATFETSDPAFAEHARAALGRRWRVVRRVEPGGAVTLSAEKGYLRETGNLVFHVSLLAALVLIAVGRLFSYQGTVIVQEGTDRGFCSTGPYDSWRPGRFAADGRITPPPFCIDSLDKFTAEYLADGQPAKFAADVTYSRGRDDEAQEKTRITVNHPLRIEGDRVYLIGHGFAPVVTVHMPDGAVRTTTTSFVPTEAATLLSEGAVKLKGKPDANQDIGIEGLFAPTPVDEGNGVVGSVSPRVSDPVLGVFVYQGSLNPNGVPQSAFTLDKGAMTRIGAANLTLGQTASLPGGVSVTFDGWVNWASLQVSHDPTQGYLLIAAASMVLGLFGSLSIRRRRVWLRITPGAGDADGSPTVVSIGGLARSDTGNFTTEFADLLRRVHAGDYPARRIPVTVGKE